MKPIKTVFKFCLICSIFGLLLIALPSRIAQADTVGPNNPGTGTNVPGIGSETWSNPGDITSPGSPYASVTLYQGHRYSNYLVGSNYGFSVPGEATITGIEVRINRMSSSRNPSVVDNEIRLVRDDVVVGENRAITNTWPTSLTVVTYGGPTDLWGATWTVAQINSDQFGVALAAYRDNNGNNSRQALVDALQITVYYQFTSETSLSCGDGTPVVYGESVTCQVTVTRLLGDSTPSGPVNWTSDGSGTFVPNPCTLVGADGTATCSVTYTPSEVGTGIHQLTAWYEGDGIFAPSHASQAVTVVKRAVTVSADPQEKVYGEPDPTLTYTVTEGSLVFGDTFSGELTRQPGEDAGQYAILQGTLGVPIDYELTYVGNYLTITKADALCVVDGWSGTYDTEYHGAIGSCSGIGGETPGTLDLGASFKDVPGGTAHWTLVGNGNYNDQSGDVEIVIAKANALCNISGYSGTYDAAYHGASGSCMGIGGENPGALNLGETFKDVPGGSALWSFTGNGNYNDQSGTAEIVIGKAEATCDVSGYDGIYDAAYHGATGACSGVGGEIPGVLDLGESYKDVPGGVASWTLTANGNYYDQAGTVEIVITKANAVCVITGFEGSYDGTYHGASGTCTGVGGEEPGTLDLGETFKDVPGGIANWTFTGNGNYFDQNGSVAILITKADAVCTIVGFDGIYDAAFHGASGSCTGVGGEEPGTLDLGESFKNVPGGTATWILTAGSNYNDQTGSVDIVIGKADAVCTITPYLLEYDRGEHSASGACTGVEGEQLIGLDLNGTAHTEIGDYPDDAWVFSDITGNYNDATGTVHDQITLRSITIIADAKTKVVGQADPVLTFQVTSGSLLSGDAFSGSLTRVPGENVGRYVILQGTVALPDYYQLTYVGAYLTITGGRIFMPIMHKG